MFCSESCRNENGFHRYECTLIGRIRKLFPKDYIVTLRAFFRALSLFDGNLKSMFEYFKANSNKTLFDFDLNHSGNQAAKDLFVVAMKSHTTVYSIENQRTIALIHEDLLSYFPEETRKLLDVHLDKSFIIEFLAKMHSNLVTLARNATVTQQINPILSMIRHSCVPNTRQLVSEDGVNTHVVILPIEKGETLTRDFLNRNGNLKEQTLEQRKSVIEEKFGYSCNCNACDVEKPVGLTPTVADQEMLESVVRITAQQINQMDDAVKINWLEKCRSYIEKNAAMYPTLEMVEMQRIISEIYEFFATNNHTIATAEYIYGPSSTSPVPTKSNQKGNKNNRKGKKK